MGGTTPWLGIPYPVGTDRVTDGDNAIRALAEFMEGTAWVIPALGAGWTSGVGGQIAYRKDGVGNVHIQGNLGYTAAPSVPAFTLPVGFRPSTWISGTVQDLGSTGAAWPILAWSVQLTGAVSMSLLPVSQATANAMLNIVFSTRPRP